MKKIIICLFFIALSGCGGEDDNSNTPSSENENSPKTTAELISTLESEGKLPILDRTDSLLGTDSDNNGIRDDIDSYISQRYSGEQKNIFEKIAKGFQSSLVVDINDQQAVNNLSKEIGNGIDCAFIKFPSENNMTKISELESITTNTKIRLMAYLKYNKALDGTSSALTEGDSCD